MCRTQYVLVLIAVYVGLAHSWDIAVSVGDRLEFYTNGTKTDTVHFKSHNLTAIAYDEVHNMMLFVDKQSDNDSVCAYDLGSTDIRCFIKRNGSNIQDLAFDPATDRIFFSDTKEGSINWISLKDAGSEYNIYENLLIKMDDWTISDIAVDSCKGFIYWTSTDYTYYMERARFDGSEREVVYKHLPVFKLAIDQQTYSNFFIDGSENIQTELLRRVDLREKYLEAEKVDITYIYHERLSAPKELTVSNDYLYWMNSSESHTTIWQRPKNASYESHVEPREISRYYGVRSVGIAANYRIKEQVQGLQNCEVLSRLIAEIAITNNSYNIVQAKQKQQTVELDLTTKGEQTSEIEQTTETEHTVEAEQTTEYISDIGLSCVHGIKVNETSVYKCTPGYIGERCDFSSCENYCLQGDCSLNDEGLPKCRCNAGYSGDRCEVNVCYGYCLNDGDCSLNETSEPVCQCKANYLGDRCEVSGCLNYCFRGSCSFSYEGLPVCKCNAGYSGERCEVCTCHGYCLNNGDCTLNEEDEPVCQCAGNHEGSRCETVKNEIFSNVTQYYTAKRNLTLADLFSNWRKPTVKRRSATTVSLYLRNELKLNYIHFIDQVE